MAIGEQDPKAHTARNDRNLFRFDLEDAELGVELEAPFLGHDQQLAIGIVEKASLHVGRGGIDVDRQAESRLRAPLPPMVNKPSTKSVGKAG